MREKFKKSKFILLIIPLGIVIIYIDQKIIQDGFLSTNEIGDHYIFIAGLVAIVIGLLATILYYDKQSKS